MGAHFFFDEEVVIEGSESKEITGKVQLELFEFDNQVRLRISGKTIGTVGDIVFTKQQCEKFPEEFESAYRRCEKVYNNP